MSGHVETSKKQRKYDKEVNRLFVFRPLLFQLRGLGSGLSALNTIDQADFTY